MIDGGEVFLANERRGVFQILELVEPLTGMRHQNDRILLEQRGDRQRRHVLLDRGERLNHVRAHVEIDAAGGEQQPVVRLRPARQDFHLEPVFRVGAVHDGLIETAMLGLGQPVGSERDLVRGERGRGESRDDSADAE